MTTLVALLAAPGQAAHQPPVITAPTAGEAVPGPTVTVSGTSAGDVELVRLFEGATVLGETGTTEGFWSLDVPLADGGHTVRARGRDATNTWTALSDAVSFTVDSVAPPSPAIVEPSDGEIVPFTPVTVEGNGEPGARVRIEISTGGDREVVVDNAGNWAFAKSFADAPHTLVARAIDAAGNVSQPSDAVTFRVDTIAPAAPHLDTPGDGSVVRPGTVRIRGRAEPDAVVDVSEGAVIGSTVAASDGTWMLQRTFSEGSHTISARATDDAGHVSPASSPMTFRVDTVAPAIPTITAPAEGEVVPHEFAVRGTAEPNATVQLVNNQAVLAQTTSAANGAWTIEMTSFSGPKQLQARVRDAAGNLSGLSPLRSFIVDADHPTLEITTSSGRIFLPTQRPRIEGRARDDLGVLAIDLHFFDALGNDVLTRNAICAACPLSQQVDWFIEQGLPPGRYTVKAWAVDRAGNRSLPSVVTYVDL